MPDLFIMFDKLLLLNVLDLEEKFSEIIAIALYSTSDCLPLVLRTVRRHVYYLVLSHASVL